MLADANGVRGAGGCVNLLALESAGVGGTFAFALGAAGRGAGGVGVSWWLEPGAWARGV